MNQILQWPKSGDFFGKWEVINLSKTRKYHFLCKCVCGETKEVNLYSLLNGSSKGCYSCSHFRHGHKRLGKISDTWKTWRSMMTRCYNPNVPEYIRYGGRNIEVCKEWHDFVNFLRDMGERPEGLTIERIDNDKNYSPDNCKWATYEEQANNRRSTHKIEFEDKNLCLREWSKITGIKRSVLERRRREGWSPERILTTPVRGCQT